jgi:hypothetical protein
VLLFLLLRFGAATDVRAWDCPSLPPFLFSLFRSVAASVFIFLVPLGSCFLSAAGLSWLIFFVLLRYWLCAPAVFSARRPRCGLL